MADSMVRRIPGGNAIPVDQMKDAIREAAAILVSPEVGEKVDRILEVTFARRLKAMGTARDEGVIDSDDYQRDLIYEVSLLQEMALEGIKVWEQAVTPQQRIPVRRAPAQALKFAAGGSCSRPRSTTSKRRCTSWPPLTRCGPR